MAKHLRKAEAKRNSRRNDHARLVQEGGMRGAPKQQTRVETNGYRKLGSMKV